MRQFEDGWEGLTKQAFWKLYDTCSAQFPVWARCYAGAGVFLPEQTLRANGLHPDKIPSVFMDRVESRELIEEIAAKFPVSFVETPDQSKD